MIIFVLALQYLMSTLVVATNSQKDQNKNTVLLRSAIISPNSKSLVADKFTMKKNKNEILNSDKFYFKYPVKAQKNHVFLQLIINIFCVVLENLSTLPPLINQLYVLKKYDQQMIVLDLIKSIISLENVHTVCSIKSILLNNQAASLRSSSTDRKTVCKQLVHFLTKNDIKIPKFKLRKNKNLKKLILEKFPEFETIDVAALLETRQLLYEKTKTNIQKTGISTDEFLPLMLFLQELYDLSTYLGLVFNDIPKSYTDRFLHPWVLFNKQALDLIKMPPVFIIVCEFVFYLLETDFIFGPQFKCSKQENSDAIIGVTKLLGVLYYVQKSKNLDANYNLTLNTLHSYVEKASFIADLPANKKIIFRNYKLLQEKISLIKNGTIETKKTHDIVCGYIYCNVSIFCDRKRPKSLV